MEKKSIVYFSTLILCVFTGVTIGRFTKKLPKKSGTINVVFDDKDQTTTAPVLLLNLNSYDDIKKMCDNKYALFDVKINFKKNEKNILKKNLAA